MLSIAPVTTLGQVTFVRLTNEPCEKEGTPFAKNEFMSNVGQQQVLMAIENFETKNVSVFPLRGCTVIDKINWSCEGVSSIKGKIIFVENIQGHRHCQFRRGANGVWEVIN